MPRSKTDYIVVHCTATPEGRPLSLEQLRGMHKARGFSDIGYNEVILLDGSLKPGRAGGVNAVGAHVAGFNSRAFGISYVGGIDSRGKAKDTRTDDQKATLLARLKELVKIYPKAIIVGHRDLSPDRNHDGIVTPDEWIKECPCFDVAKEYGPHGLPVITGKKKLIVAAADLDDEAFPAEMTA
jgi:N-acetylmuramoyl-L-alanine amidase